jgi:uncharacterized membrane protein (UPF0127 family)
MLFVLVLAFLLLGRGAAFNSPAAGQTALPVVTILRADGAVVPLSVEVADTTELVICGLMHRESMPEDQGMLFVHEGIGGFWNRNTLIPLSVAYLGADGRIIDIIDMEATPMRYAPGVVQPSPREPYSYVIEANRGWFDRNGIAAGDVADVVAAAAQGSAGQPPPLCRELGT